MELMQMKKGGTRAIYALCSRSGRCEVLDFLRSAQVGKRELAKLEHLLEEVVHWPIGRHLPETDFRYEGEGLFALKSHQLRIICFMIGRDFYCTHAYVKKGDKMPRAEWEKAMRIKKEYMEGSHE
jgi:hypothetical protein